MLLDNTHGGILTVILAILANSDLLPVWLQYLIDEGINQFLQFLIDQTCRCSKLTSRCTRHFLIIT